MSERRDILASSNPCPYPGISRAGFCCNEDPCRINEIGHRPCDLTGGCIERATCGDCWVPWAAAGDGQ